jgi:hypothetical protein
MPAAQAADMCSHLTPEFSVLDLLRRLRCTW